MFKHKVITGLVVFILLLGTLLFLSWVSLSQKKLIAYDANNYGPEGLKALNLILEKNGYRVTSINGLPTNKQPILFIITTTRLPEKQKKIIMDWVYDGGTVFELTSQWPSLAVQSNSLAGFNTSTDKRPGHRADAARRARDLARARRPHRGRLGTAPTNSARARRP
jgi:hypothetical protein